KCPAAERCFQQDLICRCQFPFSSQRVGRIESGCEISDGIFTGPEFCDAPPGAGLDQKSAIERRNQAGSDERRLPASGGADDGQEARGTQPPQQFVDLFLAAEEEVVFLRLERTEAGKGIKHGWVREHVGLPYDGEAYSPP